MGVLMSLGPWIWNSEALIKTGNPSFPSVRSGTTMKFW